MEESDPQHIRNFCIIAHIDHGKSTLADRLLEATGTVEKRKMREQVLDSMELERERGITIKMTPVRMVYHPPRTNADDPQNNAESDIRMSARTNADDTQNNAERGTQVPTELLYQDLTYRIRGALFQVRKKIGLGHKESVYHNALEIEFGKLGIKSESKKNISIMYEGKSIGMYQPDFVVENKVLIELKALPEVGRPQIEQVWSYLKGCEYKLALLVNYGSTDLDIRRIVYDAARDSFSSFPRFSASCPRTSAGVSHQVEYILNLIDTPGHIDFAYEVSRALRAVEGAVLLVDATQGVQAQTLTTFQMARDAGLGIIPAVNKVDSPLARVSETKKEVATLLGCRETDILEVSGKTGQGVNELLVAIIERVPPPSTVATVPTRLLSTTQAAMGHSAASSFPLGKGGDGEGFRALVFDFQYSNHAGVILFVRVFDGAVKKGDTVRLIAGKQQFAPIEAGIFTPEQTPTPRIALGEIGYLVTGIKEPGIARIGDTVTGAARSLPALPGYDTPAPLVWASVYPESQNDFNRLRQAFERLRLSDSSFRSEEESSGLLGRGFRCGFLGMLHLEIITERLRREFNLSLVVTAPSISYEVTDKRGRKQTVYSAARFPEYGDIAEVREPMVEAKVITPPDFISSVIPLLHSHEAEILTTENFSESRILLILRMPLRELMRGFFDEVKSVSSGFASLSYQTTDMRVADVVKVELLVAEESVPAFARIVSRQRVETEAEAAAEKLYTILPRQLFAAKIQARALGRIICSRTVRAMAKDVTGYLYGGDRTRKMKLWQKQKEGKKRLKEQGVGRVRIPSEVFLKMMQG